jgi:hypothetical protein
MIVPLPAVIPPACLRVRFLFNHPPLARNEWTVEVATPVICRSCNFARTRSDAFPVVNKTSAQFNHHLIHDYLAAGYVAAHDELWSAETLDVLSFKGGSFDATAAVLEALEPSASDRFLRTIYDWNLYAAGYALAEVEERQPGKVSPDMEEIVCAMLAEKRFEIFAPTAQRAVDALLMIKAPRPKGYLEAETFDDVVALVQHHSGASDEFQRWRALFTRMKPAPATREETSLLTDADSVVGWTAANVLKRLEVSEEFQLHIREMLRVANTSAVRWRAAHVLGSFPSDANCGALVSSLIAPDEDIWVRYGAVRSLVEQAVRADSEFRTTIFEHLRTNLLDILAEPRLTEELLNSLRVRKDAQPREWSTFSLRLLRDMLPHAENQADEERLRQAAIAVET